MMNGKFLNNKTISLCVIIGLLLILALIYWIFKPDAQTTSHPLNQQAQAQSSEHNFAGATQDHQKGKLPVLAASLQGTEIDCPIQVDANGKLVLTVGIRSCFDYFFSSLGEKTETELIADIRQYLTATLPDTASSYAIYLLDEYVAYSHTLKNLKPSGNFKTGDIEGFQKVLDQMYKVQQQFFNAAEINALFGNERKLNQFNIEQMRIHANKTLTAQQKAAELAKLIDQLPSTMADGVRVSMQFAELQQLTQEIREKGGSAGWQTQVNGYLAERDQILKSDASDASKQQSINQLRNQSFGTKEDVLRAQSYEMMHDRK